MVSIPWSRQSGPLGSASGLGDLTLCGTGAGRKITTAGSASSSEESLQLRPCTTATSLNGIKSGLRTNDVLLGAPCTALRIGPDPWAIRLLVEEVRNAADQLKRGDDLLIRAGYATEWSDYSFSGELLAIKRLKESSVRNPLIPGNAFMIFPKRPVPGQHSRHCTHTASGVVYGPTYYRRSSAEARSQC